ncbi:MAG: dihydropyrimidinase [Candidatus Aminicenantes bacterium]|nr:dihydropyrimidinase [Candidatus Aminicenantes bacterium]
MKIPQKSILIREGMVITTESVHKQDVLFLGERIAAVGDLKGTTADEQIDASGRLVLPGAVDTHVHFNDVFMNTVSVHDYETGTRAAAYGGVTSIIDFSNQEHGRPLMETLDIKKEEAKGKTFIDWGVHPVITDARPDVLAEISSVVSAGSPTIKCYMTYRSEGLMMEEKELLSIQTELAKSGGMLMVHAEDNQIIEKNVPRLIAQGKTQAYYHAVSRPPEAENAAIQSCLRLAEKTGCRLFIVHMATDKGMGHVARARKKGVDIQAETCTHYLLFTEDILKREDGLKWVCSPPLRSRSIQNKLWGGLRDGRIAMVSSDDAAYSWEAKLYGAERFDKCPNGIPGVETRLTALYSAGVASGKLSLSRWIDVCATTPARLFGLFPQKGHLAPGADADVVLFNPNTEWRMDVDTLHMAADWSAYEGKTIGKVEKVFSRGELIIDGEECLAEKGRGRYLHRKLA